MNKHWFRTKCSSYILYTFFRLFTFKHNSRDFQGFLFVATTWKAHAQHICHSSEDTFLSWVGRSLMRSQMVWYCLQNTERASLLSLPKASAREKERTAHCPLADTFSLVISLKVNIKYPWKLRISLGTLFHCFGEPVRLSCRNLLYNGVDLET